MGLLKKITLPDGTELMYHRISNLMLMTNTQNVIEVTSYASYDQRIAEKEAMAFLIETGEDSGVYVPITVSSLTCPYDDKMTLKSAYELLKTGTELEGAENVFEEGDEGSNETL